MIILPRIRTINGAMDELRKLDQNCAITPHLLRNFCREGASFTKKLGQKYYINVDMLIEWLSTNNWAA